MSLLLFLGQKGSICFISMSVLMGTTLGGCFTTSVGSTGGGALCSGEGSLSIVLSLVKVIFPVVPIHSGFLLRAQLTGSSSL